MTEVKKIKDVHELTEFEALIGLFGASNWEEHDYFASYGGIVAKVAEKGRKLMQDPEIIASYNRDIAIGMLIKNYDIKDIIKETGLSIDEINKLKKELN